MVTQVDTSSDNFVARVIWICYVVVSVRVKERFQVIGACVVNLGRGVSA